MKININVSDIARFIGQLGPHIQDETIEKIMLKSQGIHVPEAYTKPDTHLVEKFPVNDAQVIKTIEKEINQSRQKIEKINLPQTLVKDAQNPLKTKIMKEAGVWSTECEQVKKEADYIREKQQETATIVQKNVTQIIAPIVTEKSTGKAAEKIKEQFQHIDPKLFREVKSDVAKQRGQFFEKQNIDTYEKKTSKVSQRNSSTKTLQLYSDEENNKIMITGRTDGSQKDTVIESKNRQSRHTFKTGLRDYDRTQLVVYMHMWKCPKGILVEHFEDEQNEYKVDFDLGEWKQIKQQIIDVALKCLS